MDKANTNTHSFPFTLKRFSGSFYDSGTQRGEDLRTLSVPSGNESIRGSASAAREIMDGYINDYSDYAEGLAEAGGLNRKEFITYFYGPRKSSPRGCSSFVVTGTRTDSGSPLIGRNYDWFYPAKGWNEGRVIAFSGYPVQYQFTHHWAGSADCMNSAGLFISLSAFRFGLCGNPGLNWHFVIDLITLLCLDVYEAVKLIKEIPHYRSYVYLLADKNDTVIAEITPGNVHIRYPEDDYLVVTNHPVTADIYYTVDNPLHYLREESSVRRYGTIERILQNRRKADEEYIRSVLSVHRGNVCRGAHTYFANPGFGTIYSLIVHPAEKKMLVAGGHPCTHEYFRMPR